MRTKNTLLLSLSLGLWCSTALAQSTTVPETATTPQDPANTAAPTSPVEAPSTQLSTDSATPQVAPQTSYVPQVAPQTSYVPPQGGPPSRTEGGKPVEPNAQSPALQLRRPDDSEEPPKKGLHEPVTEPPSPLYFGIAPLVLGNIHFLDQPSNRKVRVGKARGRDPIYPGFVGADLSLGVMLEFRYLEVIGIELDVFYQNDKGSGDVTVKDCGSLCYLPKTGLVESSTEHELTIGQSAWHVPVLVKWSHPGHIIAKKENGKIRLIRMATGGFAIGPEFVFPNDATWKSSPAGLKHPAAATATNYIMYTLSFHGERRLSKHYDIRMVYSLRGSYNPEPKDAVARRGKYAMMQGAIEPVSYKAEWRYQLGGTIGIGWYF